MARSATMPTSIAINPMRYPTLYMYLVKLPHSVASYPEVQTSSDLPLVILKQWPELIGDVVKRNDLPADVLEAIQKPIPVGQWVPEVILMVITALVRDVIFRDDEGYLKFCYDANKLHYATPLMRTVMHFVSPSLLSMSAAKRWAMLKRGTTLKTLRSGKESLTVSLTYPPYMYHRCMLHGFAKSFQAGIDHTRARNCVVEVKIISDQECHFDLSWNFV